jgi:hypothetical protein
MDSQRFVLEVLGTVSLWREFVITISPKTAKALLTRMRVLRWLMDRGFTRPELAFLTTEGQWFPGKAFQGSPDETPTKLCVITPLGVLFRAIRRADSSERANSRLVPVEVLRAIAGEAPVGPGPAPTSAAPGVPEALPVPVAPTRSPQETSVTLDKRVIQFRAPDWERFTIALTPKHSSEILRLIKAADWLLKLGYADIPRLSFVTGEGTWLARNPETRILEPKPPARAELVVDLQDFHWRAFPRAQSVELAITERVSQDLLKKLVAAARPKTAPLQQPVAKALNTKAA